MLPDLLLLVRLTGQCLVLKKASNTLSASQKFLTMTCDFQKIPDFNGNAEGRGGILTSSRNIERSLPANTEGWPMPALTVLLHKVESGDSNAEDLLLQVAYDELRRIAAQRMRGEQSGQTLQPTALVHEAWVRVLATRHGGAFRDRRAFFAAFAGTMRRVLIDIARRKAAERHGGGLVRESLTDDPPEHAALRHATASDPTAEVLLVHEALERFEARDPLAAELVKLHYFSGLSLPEVSELLQMSRASACRCWRFARAWLKLEIERILAEHRDTAAP